MSDTFDFQIDGRTVPARRGQTVIEAADAAGVWIPRLCHLPGIEAYGGCRVCVVTANGRWCTACTQPAAPGMVVQSETDAVLDARRAIVEMLLVEGNHFCMSCEKSGRCELQALAYRLGIAAPQFEMLWPKRDVDASHDAILMDRNRCVLCGRCVRASRDLDGKHVFHFTGRGPHRTVSVNSHGRLADTGASPDDHAIQACPVGCLLPKGRGYDVPFGRRRFDDAPIGSDVERAEGR
jgi:[NiFe] hydrogenase diaphorase moiety small subunit